MANVTDKSILTAAGKALLAQLNAEEKALVIDKMIFANVPNRPEYPQPDDVVPSNDVVHEAAVEQRGRLSVDSVIYSTTLTSQEGPFEFNWTGAYCSEYGVLVTIDHHALTPKTADEPGVSGNTLVRSVVLEYKDIAEITNITVDASTWQYNATPRMKKMDDDVAQSIIDQNGKDWFIEDGFLVTPQGSAFNIKAGAGYVSGNRVTLEFDRNVQVPNKPSFIYVDAHREGTPTGEQVTLFDFVVTAEEKDDYIDANGVKHFVCKIAQVLGDGSVSDMRPEGDSASKKYVEKITGKLGDEMTGATIWPPKQNLDLKVGDVLTYAVTAVRVSGQIRATDKEIPPGATITTINSDGGTISAGG
ncbi:phage tail protein, partial [Photobacterium sanguinicancri]|uniref:phage tail-collar fiber domain-containing protein n=1 Tax=Photobacterium sanguinicancri TaxID=875932 RepID=UPI0024804C94